MNFDQRYAERTRRSAALFAEASKIVPGRAGSSARTAKLAAVAVSATMDVLKEPGLYENTRAPGDRVADGLRTLATDAGLPATVDGIGKVFQMWSTHHPIRKPPTRTST